MSDIPGDESAPDNGEPIPEDGDASPAKAPKATARGAHSKGRWKRRPRIAAGLKSRWLTIVVLVIALAAAGFAAAAWYRLTQQAAPPAFTDQQTADSKRNVCTTYLIVHQAVVLNTHLPNPVKDDPIGQLAVAGNARLALLGGGMYLRDRLAAEPATPPDLAKAISTMANTLEELSINYLAGASGFVQDPLREKLNSQILDTNKLCT